MKEVSIFNQFVTKQFQLVAGLLISALLIQLPKIISAQDSPKLNETDVSMFYKNDNVYILETESADGDLWSQMGHHGPAIENLWAGYRIYFDKKAAIDLYNKAVPRLELKKTKWYTSDSLISDGYGIDTYWVGNSIGTGSIRLWDGDSIRMLEPVKNRRALLVKEGTISQINLFSEGIPFQGKEIDVLVRITVFSGYRYAKVEAYVLSDESVQLVSGLNYNPNVKVVENEDNIISWGNHNSNTEVEVGAALIYRKADFERKLAKEGEHLLISKPTKYLTLWITTASNMEEDLNDWEKFQKYVQELTQTLVHVK